MNIPAGDLLAVAAARLDPSGRLLEANAGFLRLLGDAAARDRPDNAARFFIQPAFAALAATPAAEGGEVYRGMMTLGDYEARTWTLRGCAWRDGDGLRVVAEYNIGEIERISDQILELNRELGESQRALTQANIVLKQREAQIMLASLTDPLTGAGNRRKLEQALAAELSRARRTDDTLSALMADLDHFKRVNDRYGHAVGDKVLEHFAQLLREQTRPTDIVARYGGEEFAVLLPHASLQKAAALAERIRAKMAAATVAPLDAPVTASIGVAELLPGDSGDSLLDRADAALYEAKHGGRNRVVAARPPGTAAPAA